MKKNLLLSTILTLALTFALNAQPILDQTFNGLTELPTPFEAFTTGTKNVSIVNDMVEFPTPDAIYGIKLGVGDITKATIFSLKIKTASKWTQRSVIQFTNETGDTIAQVCGYASNPGGYYVVNEPLTSDASFTPDTDEKIVGKLGGIFGGKDGAGSKDYIFHLTIDPVNKTFTGMSEFDTATTPLFNTMGDSVIMTIAAIQSNEAFYLDSVAVNNKLVSLPEVLIPENNLISMPSLSSTGSTITPKTSHAMRNYNFRVFSLTGQKLFESNNIHHGWDAKNQGMFIYSISGTTLEGNTIRKSGKLIVH